MSRTWACPGYYLRCIGSWSSGRQCKMTMQTNHSIHWNWRGRKRRGEERTTMAAFFDSMKIHSQAMPTLTYNNPSFPSSGTKVKVVICAFITLPTTRHLWHRTRRITSRLPSTHSSPSEESAQDLHTQCGNGRHHGNTQVFCVWTNCESGGFERLYPI